MFFTIAVITSLAQHQRNEALAHGQVPLRTRSEVAKQYPYPFEGGIRAPKGEPSPLPLTSLHHLILVGCDEPGQTAGQQHANQLGECNPKSHSSDDSHVGLHETGHQIITTLLVHFSGGNSQVVQILGVAIGVIHAAARGDAVLQEVGAGAPVGIVLHATAAQLLTGKGKELRVAHQRHCGLRT